MITREQIMNIMDKHLFVENEDVYISGTFEAAEEILNLIPQWQPIETAPKDGAEIIVYDSDGGQVYISFWDLDNFYMNDGNTITHWMPLPEEPK